MKILYVSTEGTPFAKAGGLADVIGALPYSVAAKGHETAIILPYYKSIRDKWKYEAKFLTSTIVTVGWRKQYAGILTLKHKGITIYFIDNELIPQINSSYRTSSEKILCGQSLSAVFTLYYFLTSPDSFDSFIPVLPFRK